jgi:serine protease
MNGLQSVARRAAVLTLLAAIAALLGASSASSGTTGLTNPKHFFWAAGQSPNATVADSAANDLIYHGGNAGSGAIGVETKPAVYLVWWGPEWAQGFTTEDTSGTLYSSKTLQTYLQSFFSGVGGSGWANVQTQYCNGALPGSTTCVGGTGYVTNPLHQLKGVWTDPTPVPSDIIASGLAQNLVDDPIAQEAMRASAHFKYDPQATYIILTPPSTIATGQPIYCGYHTQTTSVDGLGNPYRIQYAFIPWLNTNWPGVGTTGCGMHNVNATSNAFGNGVFDGWSIVTGHEYAEAVTDPDNFASDQDGWNDAQGSENGDKCAWMDTQNISLAGRAFAVQPLWSNEAYDATGNGCVVTR